MNTTARTLGRANGFTLVEVAIAVGFTKKPSLNSPLLQAGHPNEAGSALLVCLGILAVTLLVLGTALIEASHRYRISHYSTRWAQAGQAAEAGAEIALYTAQNNSWTTTGWSGAPGAPGAQPVTNTFTLGAGVVGTGAITANVSVDTLSLGGNHWLRIQSVGSTTVYGGAVAGIDHNDVMLRKLSFQFNRYTGAAQSTPQSTRMVEILASPKSPFTMALLVNNQFNMSGGGVIDSFNSGDPAKSTNGLYDATKRQSNGNVGINNTQGASDLQNTYVFGSVTYSGAAIQNTANVQGGVSTPFVKSVTPVAAPTWTSVNASPTVINGFATLTGGTQSSPARYKVSSLNIPFANVLTLAPYAAGQQSYLEIWVTGDFTTSAFSYIVQEAGVHVKYHVQGNLNVSAGSFNNQTNIASDCIIDMINPANGNSQTATISGFGTFIGVVDAPAANLTVAGLCSLSGALIANSIAISDGASVHYDQALTTLGGKGTGYTVASWVEGVR